MPDVSTTGIFLLILRIDLDARPSVILLIFHFRDCNSLIVLLHIQTHVQSIQMIRKTEADKMIAFRRH